MQRDQPVFTMDWIEKGHQVDEVLDKLWDYWILAKDSKTFSDDEIIGNIVISALLYSGLNQKSSLEALLEHLKDPAKIRKIEDLNIIFLEPLSPLMEISLLMKKPSVNRVILFRIKLHAYG